MLFSINYHSMFLSPSFATPVGCAALALSLCAPFASERRALRALAAANLVWLVYMLIFDAMTAAAGCAVAIAGALVSDRSKHIAQRTKTKLMCMFMAVNLAALAITWQGPYSLIAFCAACTGTYATFCLSYDRLRIGIAACIFLWGMNSLYLQAWEGVLSAVLQVACQLACITRARRERLAACMSPIVGAA
jgi:hypothetical protein